MASLTTPASQEATATLIPAPSIDEIWTRMQKSFNSLATIEEEDTLVKLLKDLSSVIKPPLPQILRPTIVKDVCSFLVSPTEKPLIDRIKFLTLQEVKLNEISHALRLLPILPVLPEDEIIRACRHFRIDMVEAAIAFFQADIVKDETLEGKITFLMRNKDLSNEEIDEALDRLSIEKIIHLDLKDTNPHSEQSGRDLIKLKALRYLASSSKSGVHTNDEEEANRYLKETIGLTEEEIQEMRLKITQSKQKPPSPELLSRARKFLMGSAAATSPADEVNAFLLKQGLDIEEIDRLREEIAKEKTTSSAATANQATPSAPQATSATSSADENATKLLDERMKRAVKFLQTVPNDAGKAEEFLRNKGYNADEISLASKIAFKHLQKPEDDTIIENAVKFLQSAQAQTSSNEAVRSFLKRKGLTENQIEEANKRAGRTSAPSSTQPQQPPKTNWERAIAFLTSPNTKDAPVESKIAFLKSKGLSDAEIQKAFAFVAASQLSPNPTSAMTATATTLKGPGLPTICAFAVRKLSQLTMPTAKSDSLLAARTSFLCIAATFARSVLRLSSKVQRQWLDELDKVLQPTFDNILDKMLIDGDSERMKQRFEIFESLLADLCEVSSVSPLYLNKTRDWLNRLSTAVGGSKTNTSNSDQIDVALSLARCIHGHLSSRASALPFKNVESLYGENSEDNELGTFVYAALLRGSVDFGCGVGAPRVPMDEKNERNVSPEKDLKQYLNGLAKRMKTPSAAIAGMGCVYAGLVWLNCLDSWKCVASTLFEASLELKSFAESCSIDDCAKQAEKFCSKSSAFRLAATCAQVLVSQCAEEKQVRAQVRLFVTSHCQTLFSAARRNTGISKSFARRLVTRTYDERQSQLPLEDVLGKSQAELARLFQTNFLVTIVVLEPCLSPDCPSTEVMEGWTNVARLGFALVPVPEANKLNQWMELQIKLLGENEAFDMLAQSLDVDSEDSSANDWVLAAKIEYLMDTGKTIITRGWEPACQLRVDDSKAEHANEFAQALIFGATHPFGMLNRRCHTLATDSIALVSTLKHEEEATIMREEDNEEQDMQLLSKPSVALAMVPKYMERSVKSCPLGTEPSSLAYVVGSTLTSLGSNAHPLAQPTAIVAFFRIVQTLTDLTLVKPKNGETKATNEQKTQADLIAKLAFSALKAMSLPALAPGLDRVEQLFLQVEKTETTSDTTMIVVLPSELLKQTLFAIISRIDDAPRRAVLALWFLKRIQTINEGSRARL